MKDFILYRKFINSDRHTSIKGDGGNELYIDMLTYIQGIRDDELLSKIKDEIEVWLEIGNTSYFVMAVNLIGDLKLVEFREKLKAKKLKILKKEIPNFYFPECYMEFIDNALKRMD